MKVETKAIIIASIIFYIIGFNVLDGAFRSQPDSLGLKNIALLIKSFKWAIAGSLIAISYFQLKKKRILPAIILVPICIFLTYGDVYKLIQYEKYLSFAKASARGKVPLDPLIEKWKNDNLGHGEIRGIDLALRANVSVSVSNLEYLANRSMAEHPEHVLILQGVIRHKETPENLIRIIYEFKKEKYPGHPCLNGYDFVDTVNTPTDVLEDIIDSCDRGIVPRDAQRMLNYKNANKSLKKVDALKRAP